MSVEHYYNHEGELDFGPGWYLDEAKVDNLVSALADGKVNYETIKEIYYNLNNENAFADSKGDDEKKRASFDAITKLKPYHNKLLSQHLKSQEPGYITEIDLDDDVAH